MAISVEGIGIPIEPLNASDGGLMQAAGEVSVRPQACERTLPVASFHFAATAACTAMPPPSEIFSPLKSIFSNPGAWSIALKSVLTPEMKLQGWRCISAIIDLRSRG